MSKKLWVSVKRGFVRDPKHRQAVGEAVWLFEYMLDVAEWSSGIIQDWKDDAAADDMQLPVRTLREHRRKLAELGYITCIQRKYTQEIKIHNWTNPREYSGEVYNPKKGYRKREVSEPEPQVQGDTEGYIEDDAQDATEGSTQDVTPTLFSKNQIPNAEAESKKNPILAQLLACVPYMWPTDTRESYEFKDRLKLLVVTRVDGVIHVAGLGAEDAEYWQARYALYFKRALVGLGDDVTVRFEE